MKILHIEDRPADQHSLKALILLAFPDTELIQVDSLREGFARMTREGFDALIVSLDLRDQRPAESGWVQQVIEMVPETPVIAVSEVADESLKMRMMHLGAQDYLCKSEFDGRLASALGFSLVRAKRTRYLHRNAMHDGLTGLYNQRGFRTMWEHECQVSGRLLQKVYLVVADIDALQEINDLFGYLEGNTAILATARILESCTRRMDIVARSGGDEFLVLAMVGGDCHEHQLLERYEKAVDQYNAFAMARYPLSVSFGTVAARTDLSLDRLVELARARLAESKRNKGDDALSSRPAGVTGSLAA